MKFPLIFLIFPLLVLSEEECPEGAHCFSVGGGEEIPDGWKWTDFDIFCSDGSKVSSPEDCKENPKGWKSVQEMCEWYKENEPERFGHIDCLGGAFGPKHDYPCESPASGPQFFLNEDQKNPWAYRCDDGSLAPSPEECNPPLVNPDAECPEGYTMSKLGVCGTTICPDRQIEQNSVSGSEYLNTIGGEEAVGGGWVMTEDLIKMSKKTWGSEDPPLIMEDDFEDEL